MNSLLALSGETIAWIVAAVVAVIAIAVIIYFLLKRGGGGGGNKGGDDKPPVKPTKDYLEYTGHNDKLFELVDVGTSLNKDAPFIVPPTHCALLIRNGTVFGPYEPGEYPLYESRSGENPKQTVHSLKVIYISKTVRVKIRWGTQEHERFKYREPRLGIFVSVGAFGSMEVGVRDAKTFYEQLVASSQSYNIEELQDRIRALTVNDVNETLESVIKKKEVPYTEFTTEKHSIQRAVNDILSDHFVPDYGIEIRNFLIENINIPKEEEDEFRERDRELNAQLRSDRQKRADHERAREEHERNEEVYGWEKTAERRRKLDAREDIELDDTLYNRARDREREERAYERNLQHEDEERAWAREDKAAEREERMYNKGLDVQSDVEKSKNEALANVAAANAASEKSANAGHHCSVCGASYKPGAKYCPGCGSVIPRENEFVSCPQCGAKVPWGTQFCPHCGSKVNK